MNVLLFTTSMILLLAALTYARVETYRSFSIMQGEFNHYMSKTERGAINTIAEGWYESSPATRKGDKSSQTKEKHAALSRLSLAAFVDAKKQETYQKELPQLSALFKKLVFYLYKDHKFYQEMEHKRPDFASALLAAFMIADNLPKEQKLSRASDFANLHLHDPELNDILYLILQGTLKPEKKEWTPFAQDPQPHLEEPGEEDDEAKEPSKQEEVKSPEGYYSLLDYITLQEASKVRVYLASRPLLMAIFDDPALVNAVIETRCNIYKNVINKSLQPDQASQMFRSQFLPQSKGFDETILDFTVSKTNPRNYE